MGPYARKSPQSEMISQVETAPHAETEEERQDAVKVLPAVRPQYADSLRIGNIRLCGRALCQGIWSPFRREANGCPMKLKMPVHGLMAIQEHGVQICLLNLFYFPDFLFPESTLTVAETVYNEPGEGCHVISILFSSAGSTLRSTT